MANTVFGVLEHLKMCVLLYNVKNKNKCCKTCFQQVCDSEVLYITVFYSTYLCIYIYIYVSMFIH